MYIYCILIYVYKHSSNIKMQYHIYLPDMNISLSFREASSLYLKMSYNIKQNLTRQSLEKIKVVTK